MKSFLFVLVLGGVAAAGNGPDFVPAKAKKPVPADTASDARSLIEPTDIVAFENDSAQLRDDALSQIDRAAGWLAKHKKYNVVVEGHADASGPSAHNATLAYDRANAVKDQLVANGVAAERVLVVGYGEQGATHPVNTNDRRVVVYATKLNGEQVAAMSFTRGALRASWTAKGATVNKLRGQ